MYTIAVLIFALFALILGAYTLGMMYLSSKRPQGAVCYLQGRGMTKAQVVRAIYDYQHIQDDMGGLNSRQTETFHGLCAIAGVKPEDL